VLYVVCDSHRCVVGLNQSGKTSLVQALLAAEQELEVGGGTCMCVPMPAPSAHPTYTRTILQGKRYLLVQEVSPLDLPQGLLSTAARVVLVVDATDELQLAHAGSMLHTLHGLFSKDILVALSKTDLEGEAVSTENVQARVKMEHPDARVTFTRVSANNPQGVVTVQEWLRAEG
jgi:hypothetical protein